MRKELKAKNSKQIVVRFSPEIYTIEKVIPVKPDKVGFPLYILKNSQNQIILNESGKKRIFGGNDLLKVPDDTLPTLIDLTRANALNRIPSPQQGEMGRDLYIEPVDDPEPEPVESSNQGVKTQPISQWKSKEWKEEFKNKEFTDEGTRWIIVDVQPIELKKFIWLFTFQKVKKMWQKIESVTIKRNLSISRSYRRLGQTRIYECCLVSYQIALDLKYRDQICTLP